jgi:hypothetical protein
MAWLTRQFPYFPQTEGDSMRNSHRNKPRAAQLKWLEDYIDALLRTLAQIIGSLLPGRR